MLLSTLPRRQSLDDILSQCELHLFGRLRPDKHVQRVETAAANALFSALDQQLKVCYCQYVSLLLSVNIEDSHAHGLGSGCRAKKRRKGSQFLKWIQHGSETSPHRGMEKMGVEP